MTAQSQNMALLTSNKTCEWFTPPWLISLARQFLTTIDLDPASHPAAQEWIKARLYYTESGLLKPWFGRVWMNPPWGKDERGVLHRAGDWMDYAEIQYEEGGVFEQLSLVNSAPGYLWWEKLIDRRPVIMLRERVSFIQWEQTESGMVVMGESGPAKKGQTLAYHGKRVEEFVEHFSKLGTFIHQGRLL